jgi:GNAT superfamily N-acetyltransferase
MHDEELAQRVHRNLMDVTARSAEPGGVERSNGELLVRPPTAMPFLNVVMREGPAGDAAALIARAQDFFFTHERGFVAMCWPGDPELEQAAAAAGLFPIMERYPEMVCRSPLDRLPGDVREVTDTAAGAAYWRVCNAAYPSLGFPEGLFDEAYTPDDLVGHEDAAACVAWDGETPLACAAIFTSGGVGMVGWVAAVPEARGRGLAAACTVWATNKAFELGADVASLQASPMGESLYERLGYEHLYEYRVLGAMPPQTG